MTVDKLKVGIENPELLQRQAREKQEYKRKILRKAFNFFQDNTAHIDVVRNDKLELVYFMLLPYCHCLPKDNKIEFHENVDRQSVKSKVSDLVAKSDSLIEICKHEERLKQYFSKNKFIAMFAN